MDGWTLHWLEAEGTLAPWRPAIEAEIAAGHAAVAALLPPPRLDIIIQRGKGFGIPELGMVGNAYRRRCFGLSLDPDNATFGTSLETGALRRMVPHEVHHCLRMAGPGYGWTLGEALVSEGMAGRFTQLVFGNEPEPWECALDAEALRRHLPDAATLEARGFDLNAWFFGAGGTYPRWLGYSLGYALVGEWLAVEPRRDPDTLVNTPAAEVLAAAVPRLAAG